MPEAPFLLCSAYIMPSVSVMTEGNFIVLIIGATRIDTIAQSFPAER